jgi:hypothetical protein
MLTFTDVTLGAATAAKGVDAMQARLQRYMATLPSSGGGAASSDGGSAITATGGGTSRTIMLVLAALLAGGGTYYTLTQTAWGAKTRARIGL